jgi:hypothetical protein
MAAIFEPQVGVLRILAPSRRHDWSGRVQLPIAAILALEVVSEDHIVDESLSCANKDDIGCELVSFRYEWGEDFKSFSDSPCGRLSPICAPPCVLIHQQNIARPHPRNPNDMLLNPLP